MVPRDGAGRVRSGVMLGAAPSPMLAHLDRVLPRGQDWRYEPKFDGFRGLLWRTTSGSSGGRNLLRLRHSPATRIPRSLRASRTLESVSVVVIARTLLRSAILAAHRREAAAGWRFDKAGGGTV